MEPEVASVVKQLESAAQEILLIVHADDLGLTHSVNSASLRALEKGVISSASVMVPCPGFTEIAECVRGRVDLDIGIHITLTSEWRHYRWGPVSPKDRVSSLCDGEGYLWQDTHSVEMYGRLEEIEVEIRAQIDRALQFGIRPTHLDDHMFVLSQHPRLRPLYKTIADDYGLPARFVTPDVRSLSCISRELSPAAWLQAYALALNSLKPGTSELIVHLGYMNPELEAVTIGHKAWGAEWRQLDRDMVDSVTFGELLKRKGITLVGWRHISGLAASSARPLSK